MLNKTSGFPGKGFESLISLSPPLPRGDVRGPSNTDQDVGEGQTLSQEGEGFLQVRGFVGKALFPPLEDFEGTVFVSPFLAELCMHLPMSHGPAFLR